MNDFKIRDSSLSVFIAFYKTPSSQWASDRIILNTRKKIPSRTTRAHLPDSTFLLWGFTVWISSALFHPCSLMGRVGFIGKVVCFKQLDEDGVFQIASRRRLKACPNPTVAFEYRKTITLKRTIFKEYLKINHRLSCWTLKWESFQAEGHYKRRANN